MKFKKIIVYVVQICSFSGTLRKIYTMKKSLIACFVVLIHCSGLAQIPFLNTLNYDSTLGSPKATLKDISWLEGRWTGEALGGTIEEIWTPPMGNSMMCVFKLISNNVIKFYEIATIVEEKGTLMLRLRHFHNDLKGWEEKNETVDFKLVKVTANRLYFDGFTFEVLSKNEVNAYVIIEFSDGRKEEAKFSYKRGPMVNP